MNNNKTKSSINYNHKVEIEVLTPLHIGAGSEKDWIKGLDFVQQGNFVYKLSLKKLAKIFPPEQLSNIISKRNTKEISAKVGNIKEVAEEYGVYRFDFQTSDEIKAYIRSGINNIPIIPGSSIKGAIRSVLFSHFKEKYDNFEKKVFGSSNEGTDFMRFIKITDASFDKTALMQTKIHNLSQDGHNEMFKSGWKHERRSGPNSKFNPTGFHTTYEVILPLEKSTTEIALSEILFDKIYYNYSHEKKKEIMQENGIFRLFEIINNHTKEYIKKEIKYFEKYDQAEYTDEILDFLDYLFKEIPDNNKSCILRMAAGSGFHSITGDWICDSHLITNIKFIKGRARGFYSGEKSAKSRKFAFDEYDGDHGKEMEFYPMGFVMLTIK